MHKAWVLASVISLALVSCAQVPQPESPSPEPVVEEDTTEFVTAPAVVVSNSILGSVVSDIVACAARETSSVDVLMPLGTDPHDFQPSSEQVVDMVRADVVIVNGLGLETGLEAAVEAAKEDGAVVLEVAPLVGPLPWTEVGTGDHDDHDHGGEEFDPHFWMDMSKMAIASEVMGDALAQNTGENVFVECGVSVAGSIRSAEEEVKGVLDTLGPDERLLVTGHESLGYFAARYDFQVVGVVIPGGSTLGAPDSRELARLVEVVQESNVPAIFGNSASNPAVLDALAQEAGGVEVVELYIESLGEPGGDAGTYIGMMLANARLITDALSG